MVTKNAVFMRPVAFRKRLKRGKTKRGDEFGNYLLPVNIVEVERSNNTTVSGYWLLDMPALYKYRKTQADRKCADGASTD